MSSILIDYVVVIYWGAYLALTFLPRWLYRRDPRLGRDEVLRGFPQYRRIVDLWPRMMSALSVLLLLVVFVLWISPNVARSTMAHAIGLAYGTLLVLDATLAWVFGIRPLSGLRPRFVMPTTQMWRSALQFTAALLYLAVPIEFLLHG